MYSFLYFEDFKEQIKNQFTNVFTQEVYILSLRIIDSSKLDKSDKDYLISNGSNIYDEPEKVVKFYSSASLYFDNIECKQIKVSDKILTSLNLKSENTIFPVIKKSSLDELQSETENIGWNWNFNNDMTLLVISKKNIDQEVLTNLFK